MTPDNVALLFDYCAVFDPTLQSATREDQALKAHAWANALVSAMPLDFAMTFVTRHYSRSAERITPSMLNQAWADDQAPVPPGTLSEAHCGRTGCECSHTGSCFKGWHDEPDARTTTPCGRCRPWTARRVADAPPPGRRNDADQYRLQGGGVDRADVDMSPYVRG